MGPGISGNSGMYFERLIILCPTEITGNDVLAYAKPVSGKQFINSASHFVYFTPILPEAGQKSNLKLMPPLGGLGVKD